MRASRSAAASRGSAEQKRPSPGARPMLRRVGKQRKGGATPGVEAVDMLHRRVALLVATGAALLLVAPALASPCGRVIAASGKEPAGALPPAAAICPASRLASATPGREVCIAGLTVQRVRDTQAADGHGDFRRDSTALLTDGRVRRTVDKATGLAYGAPRLRRRRPRRDPLRTALLRRDERDRTRASRARPLRRRPAATRTRHTQPDRSRAKKPYAWGGSGAKAGRDVACPYLARGHCVNVRWTALEPLRRRGCVS